MIKQPVGVGARRRLSASTRANTAVRGGAGRDNPAPAAVSLTPSFDFMDESPDDTHQDDADFPSSSAQLDDFEARLNGTAPQMGSPLPRRHGRFVPKPATTRSSLQRQVRQGTRSGPGGPQGNTFVDNSRPWAGRPPVSSRTASHEVITEEEMERRAIITADVEDVKRLVEYGSGGSDSDVDA